MNLDQGQYDGNLSCLGPAQNEAQTSFLDTSQIKAKLKLENFLASDNYPTFLKGTPEVPRKDRHFLEILYSSPKVETYNMYLEMTHNVNNENNKNPVFDQTQKTEDSFILSLNSQKPMDSIMDIFKADSFIGGSSKENEAPLDDTLDFMSAQPHSSGRKSKWEILRDKMKEENGTTPLPKLEVSLAVPKPDRKDSQKSSKGLPKPIIVESGLPSFIEKMDHQDLLDFVKKNTRRIGGPSNDDKWEVVIGNMEKEEA